MFGYVYIIVTIHIQQIKASAGAPDYQNLILRHISNFDNFNTIDWDA